VIWERRSSEPKKPGKGEFLIFLNFKAHLKCEDESGYLAEPMTVRSEKYLTFSSKVNMSLDILLNPLQPGQTEYKKLWFLYSAQLWRWGWISCWAQGKQVREKCSLLYFTIL
jgi:hypothetical protein